MSALDHAAVRIDAPAAPPRRRLNRAAIAAVGFALLQIPLTAVALLMEWRSVHDDGTEPMLKEFAIGGSAMSGPLMPQVILGTLAALTLRGGRLGRVATAGIGVMGTLVVYNGAAETFTDPVWTPQWVVYAAAVLFVGCGLGLIAASISSMKGIG